MTGRADTMALCPPAHVRNPYNVMVFKERLTSEFGIEDGFAMYRTAMGLAATTRLAKTPIRSLLAHAADRANTFVEIGPGGARYEVFPPRTIGPNNDRSLSGITRTAYVACITGARLSARSAVVLTDDVGLLDFEAHEHARWDDRWALDPTIFCARGDDVWLIERDDAPTLKIDEAFGSLVGPHSDAFGHWLWEYLPKYFGAVAAAAIPSVPVLIDAGMPTQHRQALAAMLPSGVGIVELPPETNALVSRLWCAPSYMYMPLMEDMNARYPGPDNQACPPARIRPALLEMRARVRAPRSGFERLFLGRREQLRRRLENQAEIDALATARGFKIVYPEDYSFEEQVGLIRGARFILGPEGSAMFLTFFASTNAKLCILNHPYTVEFPRYTSLFQDLGIDVTIFTGPAVRANDGPDYPNFGCKQFADYRIDGASFSRFLDGWLA